MLTSNLQKRAIRSFVRRQGRITSRQKQALTNHWPRFGLELTPTAVDFDQLFTRKAPLVIEIGFGMGEALVAMAMTNPERNHIGIEVYQPGIGALLANLADEGLSNVRLYQQDAITVLNQCVGDNTVNGINLFFPDPWPKKRHHKRRLIQPNFTALLQRKLRKGGRVHLATDWRPYADHMMSVLTKTVGLKNIVGTGQFVAQQNLQLATKFACRAKRLGQPIWELIFAKT